MTRKAKITATCRDELPPSLVTREAAILLSMTAAGVHYHLESGRIMGRYAGPCWIVDTASVLEFAEGRGIVLQFAKPERGF